MIRCVNLTCLLFLLCSTLIMACSDKQADQNDTIFSKQIDSLTVLGKFIIQEKESTLTEISHVAFSPIGATMSICAANGNSCFIVSTKNGEVYDVIKTHYTMIDSIAQYIKFVDSFAPSMKVVTMTDLIEMAKKNQQKIDVSQILNQLKANFFSSAFLSEKQIAINILVPVLLENKKSNNPERGMASLPTLSCYSLNEKNIYSIRSYENELGGNTAGVSHGNILIIDSNTIASPYLDYTNKFSGKFEEINTIGFYNFYGEKKAKSFFLPKEYWQSNMGYSFYKLYTCLSDDSNVYINFSRIPKIFNMNKNFSFEISNLPNYSSNEYFFKNISTNHQDSLLNYLNYSTIGLYSTSNQSIIVIGYWKDAYEKQNQSKYTWFVQEYSINGKLIRMRTINKMQDSKMGKIEWIAYSKANNSIYVFYISKQNQWQVINYQWEK